MRVIVHGPQRREHELSGHCNVGQLLARLGINPEAVLVLAEGRLLTRDEPLAADAVVEVRPVVSGGA